MDATVIVAIVTTAGTIIVALITFIQNKSLKKENKTLNNTRQKLETEIKEIKLISTGMVVAYFFSFIRPLFDKIAESQLMIIEGDTKYNINGENTKLELIIPRQLDKTSFDDANDYYKSAFRVGAIVNHEGKVLYKEINYRVAKEVNGAIILIDVPAILKSALRYYKVPLFGSQNSLKDILVREMNNFKSEITRMIENDELKGKVSVRQHI
jgi:cell division protein FtsB